MKKNWLLFLFTVVALAMVPALAGAQAVVIKDSSCTVLDVDQIPFDVLDTVKVVTPSANCNKNVSCHGILPAGSVPPVKAVGFTFENTNLECFVNFGTDPDNPVWVGTENWHEVITPKGNVSLTCHFKDCNPTLACPDPSNPFCPLTGPQ